MATELRDVPACYADFGPPTHKPKGHARMVTMKWRHRPHCEICGPFRGRYLRKAGWDEVGQLWRCLACDYQD